MGLIEVYVDGGFCYKTKIGAAAFAVFEDGILKYKYSKVLPQNATCNRAEYEAFLDSVFFAEKNNFFNLSDGPIIFYSDSELLVQTYNYYMIAWFFLENKFEMRDIYGQKKSKESLPKKLKRRSTNEVANYDLVEKLLLVRELHDSDLRLVWTKGHAGTFGNELVNSMCSKAINDFKNKKRILLGKNEVLKIT